MDTFCVGGAADSHPHKRKNKNTKKKKKDPNSRDSAGGFRPSEKSDSGSEAEEVGLARAEMANYSLVVGAYRRGEVSKQQVLDAKRRLDDSMKALTDETSKNQRELDELRCFCSS